MLEKEETEVNKDEALVYLNERGIYDSTKLDKRNCSRLVCLVNQNLKI
jgi:hypothetical protein